MHRKQEGEKDTEREEKEGQQFSDIRRGFLSFWMKIKSAEYVWRY